MPLFEVADNGLHRHEATSFAELGLYERANLQRLLREQPSALGEDLLIIAEEFGQWEDSRRRIDLLALDRDAHLVVIELKRTDDGGHMELQALRYAAMVSAMTFDEVAATYQRHRALFSGGNELTDARAELADFLGLGEDPDEATISTDVRIILVSADFGREITTAVLWLNRFDGMDIRCIRLSPYHLQGTVFLDIQQVIPLPEAADYQVRLRRKDVARERSTHTDNRDFTRYHVIAGGRELPDENKRNAVRTMITELGKAGVPYETSARYCRTAHYGPSPAYSQTRTPFEKRSPWLIREPTSTDGLANIHFSIRPMTKPTSSSKCGAATPNTPSKSCRKLSRRQVSASVQRTRNGFAVRPPAMGLSPLARRGAGCTCPSWLC